jgi:hypothetical protein
VYDLFLWNELSSWTRLLEKLEARRATRKLVGELLQSNFQGVGAFHGCRPVDINEYYKFGLRRSNSSRIDERARNLFLNGQFPEIKSEHIDQVVDSIGNYDDGRIYACLDRRNLLEVDGHYLIYGSERLSAIAAHLNKYSRTDLQQVLKRVGRPTLLTIALAWQVVSDPDFDELVEKIIQALPAARRKRKPPLDDFTFEWWRDLPPEAIVECEYPSQVIDPLNKMTVYRINPLRDGSEKDEAFLSRARPTK